MPAERSFPEKNGRFIGAPLGALNHSDVPAPVEEAITSTLGIAVLKGAARPTPMQAVST
jgi:hypothetical protein